MATGQNIECSESNLRALAGKLEQVTNPDRRIGREAEKFLQDLEARQGFGVLLLRLLQLEAVPVFKSGGRAPNHVLVCAITFKNYVKRQYQEDAEHPISNEEKTLLKQHLVELMLTTPVLIQRQLIEAVKIISRQDFPTQWQSLLPALISAMGNKDVAIVQSALTTTHSILERYRGAMKSDGILQELIYILELLPNTLLTLFKTLINQLGAADPANQARILKTLLPLIQVFHDLNDVDLPEKFEDDLQTWMQGFAQLFGLRSDSPLLVEDPSGSEEVPGILHEVQREVCECFDLYCTRYEAEFKPYLQIASQQVWQALTTLPNAPKYDNLVAAAICFLTSISKGVDHSLFASEQTLKMVCESIILPNMRFSDVDEENFEDNPVDYVRRDMEGSDRETRRRSACEFVKGLRKHFEKPVTQIFSAYINKMLQEYKNAPKENWRNKDIALYLVTALTVTRQTAAGGATATNELVPLGDFLRTEVLPELEAYPNNHPVIQADALKFVTVFRGALPAETFQPLLVAFTKLIGSPAQVVHTYATNALERFCAMRVPGNGRNRAYAVSDAVIQSVFKEALTACFGQLKRAAAEGAKACNEYVMRTVYRLMQRGRAAMVPVAKDILDVLTAVLGAVAKNPSNPVFNRYLFESLGALIRHVGAAKPDAISAFESLMFPVFQAILTEDVAEFTPFVFQLMALLLHSRKEEGVPSIYAGMLGNLLVPAVWSRKGNIPGLVHLLQCVIRKSKGDLGAHLQPVLGIFKMLNMRASTDHHGFLLIESLVAYAPLKTLDTFMDVALRLILGRLSSKPKIKYIRSFLVFLSLLMGQHGADYAIQKLETIQQGIYGMVIKNFWLKYGESVLGSIERKMCAIGLSRMLCDSSVFLNTYGEAWVPLLQTTLALLELPPTEASLDEAAEAEADMAEASKIGYSVGYAKLSTAVTEVPDPFAAVKPKEFLCQSLQKLVSVQREQTAARVGALSAPAKEILNRYVMETGIQLGL